MFLTRLASTKSFYFLRSPKRLEKVKNFLKAKSRFNFANLLHEYQIRLADRTWVKG